MDNGQDAAWLPLSQAGQRLGLSRGALRKRIARGRLEARKSNDGLVRVLVTGETEPGRSQDGAGPVRDGASPVHGDGAGSVPETVHLLSALADARVAAARAEGECVALRAQVLISGRAGHAGCGARPRASDSAGCPGPGPQGLARAGAGGGAAAVGPGRPLEPPRGGAGGEEWPGTSAMGTALEPHAGPS